ncbi:MAG: nucleotidyltransferase domain-containing protein [Bacteroidales bacterium]|nr:nucleotidyltransferase domain-containing protein [Bacteroidales bacterium]
MQNIMYLTSHISQIKELCEQHNVDKLYAFGSVLTDRFSNDSDVDFLYSFKNEVPLNVYADNFFRFQEQLEKTLHRPVDLISEKHLRNPYFIEEVNATKQLIYG